MRNSFSEQWEEIYSNHEQLTSWPWSDLVSLIYCHCEDLIKQGGIVLELGCGSGPNIPFFKSLGMDYYGVEGSETVVDLVHKKYPELREKVITGDFTKTDFVANVKNIDIIIDRAAVTHNNLSAINSTLKNSYNMLKTGGYFIGVDWFSTKHSDYNLGKQGGDIYTRFDIEKGQFENVGNVHFSDIKHLCDIFSNFDIISLEEKVVNSFKSKLGSNLHHGI